MPEPLQTTISKRWRGILSVLIVVHLCAVFAPPMAFQAQGPRGLSPAVNTLLQPLASYGQFLYLDRGYAFFAPDPGPSHLMDAVNTNDVSVARYPDLEQQWPRLLYHRHFMLSEFLNDAYQPELPPDAAKLLGPTLTPEELRVWRLARQRYEAIESSLAQHMRQQLGDDSLSVARVEHGVADFVLVADGSATIRDSSSYATLEDIPITLEALASIDQTLPMPGDSNRQPDDPPVKREPVPVPPGERISDYLEPASTDEPSTVTDVDDSEGASIDKSSVKSSDASEVADANAQESAGQASPDVP